MVGEGGRNVKGGRREESEGKNFKGLMSYGSEEWFTTNK